MIGLLQAGRAIPSTPIDLIRNATPLTKAVLVVLAVLSLISWASIFGVWVQLIVANSRAMKFVAEFDRTRRLDEANAIARKARSALARLFLNASHFVVETR